MKAGGLEKLEDYGDYKNRQERCHYNSSKTVVKVTGYREIPPDEKLM
jgi:hypothetical protein